MAYIIGIIISFVLYVVVGAVLSRKVNTAEDYYVSGRNAPTLLIVGTLIASYLSTVAFMGESGFSYSGYPIIMLILFVFNTSGYVFGAFLFGRYLRRSESLTLPEYFGNRFNSTKVRMAASITTIIGISAYLIAVTQGGAILLAEILNVGYVWALVIMWIVYTSFTFMSGAKGVIFTDAIMFFIFMLGTFVGIPFIIYAVGGWPDAITNTAALVSKPDILSWHGITGENATMGSPIEALIWAVTLGLVWGFVVAVSPWQSSRYLMAKNEHVVVRSGMIAMVVALFFGIVLHVGSAAINLANPEIFPIDYAFVWATINLMPTWVGVLVLSGILAAAISSCSTFLQLIGNSVGNDLLGLRKGSKLTNKQLLRYGRVSMLISSFVILLIGIWQPPSIMWIGYFAATLFAASWGPVAFASIYSKNITSDGAFWSIITGFLGVILVEVIKLFGVGVPVYLDSAIVGTIISLIVLFAVSKLGVPTIKEQEFLMKLHQPPIDNGADKDFKITRKYPVYLRISGIALILLTFLLYYWPAIIR